MQNKQHRNNSRKQQYRVRNWRTYTAALVARGSLDLWIDPDTVAGWNAEKTRTPGAPRQYSALAISCALTLGSLFRLPLRSVEGFLGSVVRLSGISLAIPDFSTLSRRGRHLPVPLRARPKENTVMIVDSTGVKVYGEGEWKVRQHGASKRRTWKKIHIAIGEDGEIRATEATDNATHDSAVVPALLAQEEATITAFAGDGAYDHRAVYTALRKRGVPSVRIPPRKGARIWQNGNRKEDRHARDENLRAIRRQGRGAWKCAVGYHIRSRVEATMFRLKTILGDRLRAREWSRQVTELTIRCAILNRMHAQGMPDSVAVA